MFMFQFAFCIRNEVFILTHNCIKEKLLFCTLKSSNIFEKSTSIFNRLFYGTNQLNVSGEKMLITFCSECGSNPRPSAQKSAIKADLYRKAVQMCIIPKSTTYQPSILDSSQNLNVTFNEPIPDTNMVRAHRTGYLHWAPDVTGGKC